MEALQQFDAGIFTRVATHSDLSHRHWAGHSHSRPGERKHHQATCGACQTIAQPRPQRHHPHCEWISRWGLRLRFEPCSQLLWHCTVYSLRLPQPCLHVDHGGMGLAHVLQPHLPGSALSWRHRVWSATWRASCMDWLQSVAAL